jgi:hypothetical protein
VEEVVVSPQEEKLTTGLEGFLDSVMVILDVFSRATYDLHPEGDPTLQK